MSWADRISMLILAALWGGSFLFLRIAAPEFGPVPLIMLRVLLAGLMLLPVIIMRRKFGQVRANIGALFVLGVLNSMIPFTMLAWASLSVTAGYVAILNATVPFFVVLVSVVWLKERMTLFRAMGLLLGFTGVVVLGWGHAGFKPGGSGWAIVAALIATFSYGISSGWLIKRLPGVDPMVVTAGSFLASGVMMLPITPWFMPEHMPSLKAWTVLVMLATFSTAIAYVLFYRLVDSIGPTRSITVTFLVPLFAMIWGFLVLGEPATGQMVAGAAIILAGMGLIIGAKMKVQQKEIVPQIAEER